MARTCKNHCWKFKEFQPRYPASDNLQHLCFLDTSSDDLKKMTWLHHYPFLLCFVGALGWHEPLLRGSKARGTTLLERSDSLLIILKNRDIPRVVVGGV